MVRSTSVAVGAAIVMIVIVGLVGIWIRDSAEINAFDISVLTQLAQVRTPVLVGIALDNAVVFGVIGAIIVTVVLAALMAAITRSFALTWRFVAIVIAGWGCVELVKRIVQRPRPTLVDVTEVTPIPESFSYPSGHTAFATALGCAFIAVCLWRQVRKATFITVCIGAGIMALGTAFCRMLLGVHHLTDVTASLILVPVVCIAVVHLVSPKPRAIPVPATAESIRETFE